MSPSHRRRPFNIVNTAASHAGDIPVNASKKMIKTLPSVRPAGDSHGRCRLACRRMLGARTTPPDRRAAILVEDRKPDGAAGLQAGADADADAADRDLQSEFAVAKRLARLLQGSARAPGRRHPDGDGQHHRQGGDRQRDAAQPDICRRQQRRQFLRKEDPAYHQLDLADQPV